MAASAVSSDSALPASVSKSAAVIEGKTRAASSNCPSLILAVNRRTSDRSIVASDSSPSLTDRTMCSPSTGPPQIRSMPASKAAATPASGVAEYP